MKIYIFLTNSLGGYSGGPSYVRNKKDWLEQHGWDVIAFDSTGNMNTPIKYIDFFEYSENRIEELYYHPSWFAKRDRERVIKKILSKVDLREDDIVVESNTLVLAEWGEIIAKRINAKHLVFLIGENVKISDANEFSFFYHKYKNNELFSISSKAFQSLWGDFYNVDDSDNHYWNAMSMTVPQDTPCNELDIVNDNADITITHFGRFKDYVPNVINEIYAFADNNNDKLINFIFFGIKTIPIELKSLLEKKNNILMYFFDSVFPIPKRIFQISDVVVATAGCAAISAREGVKTISYNVETNIPLGIMGYTTTEISYSGSTCESISQHLSEILDDILIKNLYDYSANLQLFKYDKGYEYQMSFINERKHYFDSIMEIDFYRTNNQLIQRVLCKIGLVHIASCLRYYKCNKLK